MEISRIRNDLLDKKMEMRCKSKVFGEEIRQLATQQQELSTRLGQYFEHVNRLKKVGCFHGVSLQLFCKLFNVQFDLL